MNNEIEIWEDVVGYEGLYEVSSFGNVKSLNYLRTKKEKLLKQCFDKNGYKQVRLYKNGISKTTPVHKEVAKAFHGHIPCGYDIVVDHIDNNKLNNYANNINLVTNRENSSKDRKGGTSKYLGVSLHKTSLKWVASIVIEGKKKHLGLFDLDFEASNAYQNALKKLM